ncbi:MAG: DUF4198 domain-containing protein [Pseudomonadota bacterium]
MRLLFLLLISFTYPLSAFSHESWIEPELYRIASDQQIRAHIRVGEEFIGESHSYNKRDYRMLELNSGNNSEPITGRLGNIPAIQILPSDPGLHILRHESIGTQLEYEGMEKFKRFVESVGLPRIAIEHLERRYPTDFFRERFVRFSKALIAVGAGRGADSSTDWPVEIIAVDNPYTQTNSGPLTFVLLKDGDPWPNHVVTAFLKSDDDSVDIRTLDTDSEGRFILQWSGNGSVLLSAVTIAPEKKTGYDRKTLWRSNWASLTFGAH